MMGVSRGVTLLADARRRGVKYGKKVPPAAQLRQQGLALAGAGVLAISPV